MQFACFKPEMTVVRTVQCSESAVKWPTSAFGVLFPTGCRRAAKRAAELRVADVSGDIGVVLFRLIR